MSECKKKKNICFSFSQLGGEMLASLPLAGQMVAPAQRLNLAD